MVERVVSSGTAPGRRRRRGAAGMVGLAVLALVLVACFPPPVLRIITTVAGDGTAGFSGDGGPAGTARVDSPRGLATSTDGALFVADTGNHVVRRVGTDGSISTVAGDGTAGFSGDGGPATSAQLSSPHGVAVGADGAVFVADTGNHVVRRVGTDGSISTVAGDGTAGFSGDGGPATSGQLRAPWSVALAPTGQLVISDRDDHRLRSVATDGTISTIAGTGVAGFAGDGGPATAAQLASPTHVAVDATGRLAIADGGNHRIRVIADGTIATEAGDGVAGFAGDEGAGPAARLDQPDGVAYGPGETLWVADTGNQRVRKVYPGGSALSGYVTDGAGAVAGLEVRLHDAGDPTTPVATTTTAGNGRYGFSMPTGEYLLEVVGAPGHVGEWWPDAATSAEASTITLTAGARRRIDVTVAVTPPEPLRLGGPHNFLGSWSGSGVPAAWVQHLQPSVSGYCARLEQGDRFTPRADRNGANGSFSCEPGSQGTWPIPNPAYDPAGYLYGIEVPASHTGDLDVEVYSAPHCQGTSNDDDSGANTASARGYRYVLRDRGDGDPLDAPVLDEVTLGPSDCGTWGGRWRAMFHLDAPAPGTYHLQVLPLVPTNRTGTQATEGQNQFAIRLATDGVFTACTSDPADAAYDPACPNVFARDHLGLYVSLVEPEIGFPLVSIGPEYGGATLEVELFDPAEGANYLALLDPNGTPVTFTWEVACKDETYPSEHGGACTTGEAAPSGGYGPATDDTKYTGGTGTPPWPELTQNGRYSDRLLRFRVALPDDLTAAYGDRTWWKVRYTAGNATGDRTTWSVRVLDATGRVIAGDG